MDKQAGGVPQVMRRHTGRPSLSGRVEDIGPVILRVLSVLNSGNDAEVIEWAEQDRGRKFRLVSLRLQNHLAL